MMELPKKGEVFTFDDGEGRVLTFAVCLMNEFVEKHAHECPLVGKITQPIVPDHIAHVRKKMGIEQDRLDRLADPWLHKPLIGVMREKVPLSGFSLIDGNHRIVRLHELGETEYQVWVFHPLMWRQFLLHPRGLRDDWRNIRSGVIEAEREADHVKH